MMHLEVHNEALEGKTLLQVKDFMGRDLYVPAFFRTDM